MKILICGPDWTRIINDKWAITHAPMIWPWLSSERISVSMHVPTNISCAVWASYMPISLGRFSDIILVARDVV